MSVRKFLGLAAALAVFTACGETPTDPQPLDSDLLAAAAAANPVVLSASGGGKITGPPGQDRFTFHGKKRADGTVKGGVTFESSFFGETLRGNVVCMASRVFFGVTVMAIGTDVASPNPEITGPYFLLLAIDGGEGANAAPDKLLPDFLPAEAYGGQVPADAAGACDSFGIPPFVLDFFAPLDAGNIQVGP